MKASKRTCTFVSCGVNLTKTQDKFCSYTCKNKTLRPGSKGGRPSVYRRVFATEDVYEYLKWSESQISHKLKNNKIITTKTPSLPSIAGFSVFLFKKYTLIVHVNTMRNWSYKHKEFASALSTIKETQETFLINNGLTGSYNPMLTVFLLKANHGYGKTSHQPHKYGDLVREVYSIADKINTSFSGS